MSSTFTPKPNLHITQAGQHFQVRQGPDVRRVSDDAAKLLMLLQDETLSFSQVAERAVTSTTGLTRTQAQRALLELMRHDLVTQNVAKAAAGAVPQPLKTKPPAKVPGEFIGPSSTTNGGMREVLPSVVQPQPITAKRSALYPPRELRTWLRPFRQTRFVAMVSLVTMFLIGIPVWAAILLPRAATEKGQTQPTRLAAADKPDMPEATTAP